MVGVGDVNIEGLARTLPGSFQRIMFRQHEGSRLAATLLDLVDAVGGRTVHQAGRSGCGVSVNGLSRIADDSWQTFRIGTRAESSFFSTCLN